VVARQAKVARIISNDIIPRLLKLHNEVIPDAPPVASLIETFAPAARI
jgi:MerR family transcriptional regulator, light-induced transcriptional regulator